jgi:hypothetical protein
MTKRSPFFVVYCGLKAELGVVKMTRTLEETQALLEEMRLEFVPDEDLIVDDILIEAGGKLLVRKSTLTYLAGEYYFGFNHEIWLDREMYDQGIYGEYLEDGEEVSYCSVYGGSNDEEMIQVFREELERAE